MKDGPRRIGLANGRGCKTFVVTVIPLSKIFGVLGFREKPREFASAHGSNARTGEHKVERVMSKHAFQFSGAALAFGREFKIGPRGVSTVETPLCFTVTNEKDAFW